MGSSTVLDPEVRTRYHGVAGTPKMLWFPAVGTGT
jgi:hypothetical protein